MNGKELVKESWYIENEDKLRQYGYVRLDDVLEILDDELKGVIISSTVVSKLRDLLKAPKKSYDSCKPVGFDAPIVPVGHYLYVYK